MRWLDAACGERTSRFDVIIMDPPYGTNLTWKSLVRIFDGDLLNAGGFILCECEREVALPKPPEPYLLQKTYPYGNKMLALYTKTGEVTL